MYLFAWEAQCPVWTGDSKPHLCCRGPESSSLCASRLVRCSLLKQEQFKLLCLGFLFCPISCIQDSVSLIQATARMFMK
ncbi:mCG147343 [Mus musculus]|nr:mCG147343 [Mus musculus]